VMSSKSLIHVGGSERLGVLMAIYRKHNIFRLKSKKLQFWCHGDFKNCEVSLKIIFFLAYTCLIRCHKCTF